MFRDLLAAVNVVQAYRCFGATYCLHHHDRKISQGGNTLLRNFIKFLSDYTWNIDFYARTGNMGVLILYSVRIDELDDSLAEPTDQS
jgi:hypothetical protein